MSSSLRLQCKTTDFHVLYTTPPCGVASATLDLLSRTQYNRKAMHCPPKSVFTSYDE